MTFKIKTDSITANNDTAPVNSIGLNTPNGVKYLSGESGSLTFGGETIGGGGGVQVVTVDMTTMTCSHSASEIFEMVQTAPVYVSASGQWAMLNLIGEGGSVKAFGSMFVPQGDMMVVNTMFIDNNKAVTTSLGTITMELMG